MQSKVIEKSIPVLKFAMKSEPEKPKEPEEPKTTTTITQSTSKSNSKSKTATTKPKKTKSRNGCLTCKKKRLKCGEEKPFCLNCTKKNIVCGGYSMNFKWKDLSQSTKGQKMIKASSSDTKNNTNKKKIKREEPVYTTQNVSSPDKKPGSVTNVKNSSPENNRTTSSDPAGNSNLLQEALEAATLGVTGKSTQEIAIANALIASGKNPDLAAAIASTLNGLANTVEQQHLAQQQKSSLPTSVEQTGLVGSAGEVNRNQSFTSIASLLNKKHSPNGDTTETESNSTKSVADEVPISVGIKVDPENEMMSGIPVSHKPTPGADSNVSSSMLDSLVNAATKASQSSSGLDNNPYPPDLFQDHSSTHHDLPPPLMDN
ncbi:unnamed protein product [Ambrosiozyma monospora]|uniref:Unnamed protein product n=1 Tax=Ambrosiozyma monospora TaxID=43982 RepID=A0ACB5SSU8_AMBMO|nr:unnamed protein product [Ambrosiozyma monospora]